MAGILDDIDKRTRLAGQNRLELLLFRLGDGQRFGINVFKVQEVIRCPPLTRVPLAHRVVRGMATMRGRPLTVMDLALAIGRPPLQGTQDAFVIITEYNRRVQGFLVSDVDRIVNMKWEEILPPPWAGAGHYMTAVTRVGDDLVQIIDVEKIMAEVTPVSDMVSPEVIDAGARSPRVGFAVLVADDSSVARKQILRTLEQLGIEATVVSDGRQALDHLKGMAAEGEPVSSRIQMVISDVEMPEMDGYTLTTEIRADDRLKDLYVVLHTSLSGVFNHALVERVGADRFIPKFNPDELARAVVERADAVQGRTA